GLGQSAPNPVLSNLRYFRKEFERHIHDKRCDAFVCRDLVGSPCQAACPIGTEAWRYVAHIARGEYEEAYKVIREENPFPSICARVCDHKCESQCRLGASGHRAVAIRALKRFVTERFEPKDYPAARKPTNGNGEFPVAVVGTGPAGLTAAHYLSREGYKVTLIEAESKPGGMLLSGVPAYRLPREVLEKEIEALLDDTITLRCDTVFGKDVTVDSLFEEGHKSVFLALGAHRSRKLGIDGEDASGVYPSMKFLKAWNLKGENLAQGRVGVIGGGNSAIDAARVALRQPGVDNVTLYYRRTEHEMPAFASEIEAAREEGVEIVTLVSPVRIVQRDGKISGIELQNNRLGKLDASGRRRPVPVEGSEHVVGVDTLVVAIGEQIQPFEMDGSMDIQVTKWGTIVNDDETLQATRKGVFAGGDVVTGPNTVVDAIAAGKRAARMIDRYLHEHELRQPAEPRVPRTYVQPELMTEQELESIRRAEPPKAAMDARKTGFTEVELVLSEREAKTEARRCLRCDLEFTKAAVPVVDETVAEMGGAT
ncbi:MAG: FAD-dependent oxidoreductase, partial [Myxococcota bacterium]